MHVETQSLKRLCSFWNGEKKKSWPANEWNKANRWDLERGRKSPGALKPLIFPARCAFLSYCYMHDPLYLTNPPSISKLFNDTWKQIGPFAPNVIKKRFTNFQSTNFLCRSFSLKNSQNPRRTFMYKNNALQHLFPL